MSGYSDVLNKNLRNWIYLKYNKWPGRRVADSKLRTKKILDQFEIPNPKLMAVFKKEDQVAKYPWEKLDRNFVVKPVKASGGEGIEMTVVL